MHCYVAQAMQLHDRHLMTDGQTITPSVGEQGDTNRQKYRLDKISWVDGVEPHCLNIGTLVTLLDTIMQQAKVQRSLSHYHIKGRTKVGLTVCLRRAQAISGCSYECLFSVSSLKSD